MSEFTAIATDVGPTLWAKRLNQYTVKVVEGTTPNDPRNTYILSNNEIERLSNI